jgi:ATP-dependent DNA helicase RecG
MPLDLTDKVERVPLVGPLKARLLSNLEIFTIYDLLHHYPFRYDDFTNTKKIAHVVFGETVTINGSIIKSENIYTKNHKSITKVTIGDGTGQMDAIWFNQPYLSKTLRPGLLTNLSGKIDWFTKHLVLISPEYELIANRQEVTNTIHTGRLVPIYSETAGISSKWIRNRISFLLRGGIIIKDHFSPAFLSSHKLISLTEALNQTHFPQSPARAKEAKTRLAFDELFFVLLASHLNRNKLKKQKSNFTFNTTKYRSQLNKFIQTLPFKLTDDQTKAITEITNDMSQIKPMNRLLQGDVGSGKTVVAAVATLATHLSGLRTLYMAPTEILANQHYLTLKSLLEPAGVKIGLLTSSTNKRAINKPRISNYHVVVGTHALLFNLEETKEIGLVIIDEQHKFGVEQRTGLLKISKGSGNLPHLLTMTATPIPRTLALTLLGDLDITFIRRMPKDRIPVKTWLVPREKRDAAYIWIKGQLSTNRSQAYIVCPFIEESEVETLKSVRAAKKEADNLIKVFSPLKVELLHGKMKPNQKEQVMETFRLNNVSVLVSTPIVEVGLDNPNASIILIEGAERFGLASLHQLRGRVGRGTKQSYCFLFTDNESPEVNTRLKLLEKYNSGLILSEMDLRNRGGGEIYGRHQSGFTKTRVADLTDLDQITKVNLIVKGLFKRNDPILRSNWLCGQIKQLDNVHMD